MTTGYTGPERRKLDEQYKNILIRMDANLQNLVEDYKSHKAEDLSKFKLIFNKIDFHSKIIYGALAVVAFIELLVKLK